MMNKTKIIIFALIVSLLATNASPVFGLVDTLDHSDFNLESWSKTIDFFDYARRYAAQHNRTPPPDDSHAYLYLTYVNVSGMQMFYAGLSNITVNQRALTIPIQTFMMHYKTKDGLKDVVTASSFVMLLAFSEDSNSNFTDSPDRNDTLFASFSLGFDLSAHFGDSVPPSLNSKTEIIPLTSSSDNLTWHWGMRYTNLTAIWWEISIDPHNPNCDSHLIAISRYDELTFTYNLTINPETGKVTLSTNYIVGKMTDLWVFRWFFIIPFIGHYNATGCYTLKGVKLLDMTIYRFLQNQGIKMSIVQFQNTVVLDHTAYFNSSGTNVNDNEVSIDNSTVSTFTDDGEKIFDTDFATKREYNLYNYTADPEETMFETYNTTTRTYKISGFARNPIFNVHTSLMRLLPLVVAHMDSELYQQAKERLLNMSHADYLYIVAYPTYSGYRIEHDPTYTAYCSLTTEEPTPPPTTPLTLPKGLMVISLAVVATIAYAIIRRRNQISMSNIL